MTIDLEIIAVYVGLIATIMSVMRPIIALNKQNAETQVHLTSLIESIKNLSKMIDELYDIGSKNATNIQLQEQRLKAVEKVSHVDKPLTYIQ